jgi:enhancer of polycomb-like protein
LGIKGDDQDLVNQKPVVKAPKPDATVIRIPGMIPKVSLRPDGRLPDSDLQLLAEDRMKRDAEISTIIQESMAKHRVWNSGWVDNTWRPITPPLEMASKSSFRAAVTEFLPTPPASASTDRSHDSLALVEQDFKADDRSAVAVRYASPPLEIGAPRPSFRRRIGRGGRLWIDRRGLSRSTQSAFDEDADERLLERLEYDVESDEDTEVFHTDPYDNINIRYRMLFSMPTIRDPAQQQKLLEEAQRRNANTMANGVKAVLPPGHGASPPQTQKVISK